MYRNIVVLSLCIFPYLAGAATSTSLPSSNRGDIRNLTDEELASLWGGAWKDKEYCHRYETCNERFVRIFVPHLKDQVKCTFSGHSCYSCLYNGTEKECMPHFWGTKKCAPMPNENCGEFMLGTCNDDLECLLTAQTGGHCGQITACVEK